MGGSKPAMSGIELSAGAGPARRGQPKGLTSRAASPPPMVRHDEQPIERLRPPAPPPRREISGLTPGVRLLSEGNGRAPPEARGPFTDSVTKNGSVSERVKAPCRNTESVAIAIMIT